MEEKQAYQEDIESIRKLMERSVKFISLSGLSGIMAGVYALLGALAASFLIPYPLSPVTHGVIPDPHITFQLLGIAATVLVASLLTGVWMSSRKAKKSGVKLWDTTSKRLVINLAIPLVTGGLFIINLVLGDHVGIVAPSFLIFYGLALINASPNVYEEVRYLGYSEIILGLVCAVLQRYGLLCWAIGFGVFHILYGVVMYKKYDA
jgi:hypothetical protein